MDGSPWITTSTVAFAAERTERSCPNCCRAAHWSGPRPSTPLLWTALDFGGDLSAEVRESVEASLAQYETGDFAAPPTCGGASTTSTPRTSTRS